MAKPLTYLEFKCRVDNCRDGSYKLLTLEPTDGSKLLSRTPIIVQHSCGHAFNTKFQSFVNDGKGSCERCFPPKKANRTLQRVTEDILKERLAENSPHLEYVSGYTATAKKCTFLHKDCGETFETTPKEVFRYPKNLHCPTCTNKKIRGNYISSETYLEDLLEKAPDGNEYEWIGTYNNDNKEPIKIRHKKCNKIYYVRPNSFQQGNRCPFCTENPFPKESRNVKRIKQRLDELGIDYVTEFADKRCRSKDKNGQLRFDFVIPHLGKMIVLEYDGEMHFKENIESDFSKRIIENAISRDKYKDDFVNSHPEKYYPIERISYKDKIIERLDEILSEYFEF